MTKTVNSALDLAILFHDTYERLAPQFGYETRPETRKFSPSSPNGQLMRAVCEELLRALRPPVEPPARHADCATECEALKAERLFRENQVTLRDMLVRAMASKQCDCPANQGELLSHAPWCAVNR